jgi:hypothetical protein
MVYVRRMDAAGRAEVPGRAFEVERLWTHQLDRAEVGPDAGRMQVYRLRRRDPGDEPLLKEVVHRIQSKSLHE